MSDVSQPLIKSDSEGQKNYLRPFLVKQKIL